VGVLLRAPGDDWDQDGLLDDADHAADDSDGEDNDGDGLADQSDPGCESATDQSEACGLGFELVLVLPGWDFSTGAHPPRRGSA